MRFRQIAPKLRRVLCALALLSGLAVRLVAQDVTFSPIEWIDPARAPDELPTLKRTPRIEFPTELRNTAEIGYVVFDAILDQNGDRRMLYPHASLAAYFQAYERANDPLRFSPARRDGKPVNTAITVALLFNPASAGEGQPDATPRLLDVSVVHVDAKKDAPAAGIGEYPVVFAKVRIGTDGRIAAVEDAPTELLKPISIAAKNWLFAPARRGGQPIEAEIRVPFVIVAGTPHYDGKSIPPKVVKTVPPVYPWELRASGMRGEVWVDFVVGIEGRARNAFVARSLNPAFDDAALDAVLAWRFQPGTVNGVPVNTHMLVPIVFQLESTENGGDDGIRTRRRSDMSKVPPELRYDVEPKLLGAARPVYPYALLAANKTGHAKVIFVVDKTGHVTGARVAEATAPEFGQALLAAVERFEYQPALKNGSPSLALVGLSAEFSREAKYGLVSDDDLDLLRRELKKPQTIAGAGGLDELLRPVSRQPPQFPSSLAGTATQGRAVVEFLIDEDGRARLPRIVSASQPEFGYAAVQAIAHWRFTPPKRGGRAVVARVEVPMKFNAQPAPTAAAK